MIPSRTRTYGEDQITAVQQRCWQNMKVLLLITHIVMNKASLAELVQTKIGGTKVQAEEIVESLIDAIVNTLKGGGEVSIAGLGIFSTKLRKARQARNPRTGASISVPAMKVPKFRAAKALKEAVK